MDEIVNIGPVNEKTSCVIPATFTDENGNAVTPTLAEYRIDDESGQNIVPLTAFTPPNIAVSATQNAMISTTKLEEIRTVTVHWTYGTGKEGWSSTEYTVQRVKYAS